MAPITVLAHGKTKHNSWKTIKPTSFHQIQGCLVFPSLHLSSLISPKIPTFILKKERTQKSKRRGIQLTEVNPDASAHEKKPYWNKLMKPLRMIINPYRIPKYSLGNLENKHNTCYTLRTCRSEHGHKHLAALWLWTSSAVCGPVLLSLQSLTHTHTKKKYKKKRKKRER